MVWKPKKSKTAHISYLSVSYYWNVSSTRDAATSLYLSGPWDLGPNTYLLNQFPGITLDVPELRSELLGEINS